MFGVNVLSVEKGHRIGPLRCAGYGLWGGVLQVDTKAVGFSLETPFICRHKGPMSPGSGSQGRAVRPRLPGGRPSLPGPTGWKAGVSLKDRVHSTRGSQASSRHFCGLLTSFPGSRTAFWRLKLASLIAFTSSSNPVGLPLLTFPLSEQGLACAGSTGWEIRVGARAGPKQSGPSPGPAGDA